MKREDVYGGPFWLDVNETCPIFLEVTLNNGAQPKTGRLRGLGVDKDGGELWIDWFSEDYIDFIPCAWIESLMLYVRQ